jgi:hypothetical protein
MHSRWPSRADSRNINRQFTLPQKSPENAKQNIKEKVGLNQDQINCGNADHNRHELKEQEEILERKEDKAGRKREPELSERDKMDLRTVLDLFGERSQITSNEEDLGFRAAGK